MIFKLPEIEIEKLSFSFEELLFKRRSVRSYLSNPLSENEISKLCFAAYGLRNPFGYKTVPSAGALYPMRIYLFLKRYKDLENALFLYMPENHSLKFLFSKNILPELVQAALNQDFIMDAPLNFIITANFGITMSKYGKRGIRYVLMEAGHISQNIYLMATYLKLGTVAIGAFIDELIKIILDIKEHPLYIMPVGYPAE